MKVLILCTGNNCRSQMAHSFLYSFDKNIIVCSAGTNPSQKLNEKAVAVMKEVGLDISQHKPKSVIIYPDKVWDYVKNVCDDVNETCPVFTGNLKHQLHIGFEDPSHATGTEEFIRNEFRRVRDKIKEAFYKLYVEQIKTQNNER